jgi:hypothetical protein
VTGSSAGERVERWLERRATAVAAVVFGLGVLARLRSARGPFVTPDEALHLKIATGAGAFEVYRNSLYNAHPPLFAVLLHYWKEVARSDWTLRLLPVLFGCLFLAAAWAWARRLLGEAAALLVLAFTALLPSVVSVSSELRGYSLLLCCVAAALAALERALDEKSPGAMGAFAVLGALALLSHYAAFRFAAAAFVYSAVRLAAGPKPRRLVAAWAGAFALLAVLGAILARTHLATLRGGSLEAEARATWLAESYYRSGAESAAGFLGRQTLSLFDYLFSSPAAGAIALGLFLSGAALLAARRRAAAILVTLPVLLAAAGGLLDLYPYGGTRHSIDLVIFMAAGVAAALSALTGHRRWIAVLVAAALAPAAFLAAG